ncbi:hypothetical protein [Streptomyces bacillaris]|uniref:hypothetical protein n=1 Tax=Streptomyces bacillaris TaxID=68179 RepID=UPI0036FFA183
MARPRPSLCSLCCLVLVLVLVLGLGMVPRAYRHGPRQRHERPRHAIGELMLEAAPASYPSDTHAPMS